MNFLLMSLQAGQKSQKWLKNVPIDLWMWELSCCVSPTKLFSKVVDACASPLPHGRGALTCVCVNPGA